MVVKVEVSLKIPTHFHSLKSIYIALKIQDFNLSDITGNRSLQSSTNKLLIENAFVCLFLLISFLSAKETCT